MTVGSLFSGCGGFDLGFEQAGFTTLFRCEIDDWCRRILTQKMPACELYGDVRGVSAATAPTVDVLIGGFPCQDVSVPGRGAGLDGDRSGLFFEFDRVIGELLPQWVVIENVPGLLSNRQGRDFATVLVHMAERGYGIAWRVFNSRYFGVAQRRRRVFLVCCLGDDGRRARSVLFESDGVPWRAAARDEARSDVAATLRGRASRRGVNPPGRGGEDDENLVAHAIRQNERNTSQGPGNYVGVHLNQRGKLRQSSLAGSVTTSRSASQCEGVLDVADPILANEYRTYDHAGNNAGKTHKLIGLDFSHALTAPTTRSGRLDPNGETFIASAIAASAGHHGHSSPRGDGCDNLVANTLLAPSGGSRVDDLNQTFMPTRYGVRRLTPLECERVQGFPDGWTCLCGVTPYTSKGCTCPDTPRYRALGNAVTVPVSAWIAERLKGAMATVRTAQRGLRFTQEG